MSTPRVAPRHSDEILADRLERDRLNLLSQVAKPDDFLAVGVRQFAPHVHPDIVPLAVLDQYFQSSAERSRRVIDEWLYAQAVRFTRQYGSFEGLAKDRESFAAIVQPLLRKHGASTEDWVRILRLAGKWSGP